MPRLIDADAFEVVTAQGVSMDFADGMQYVLEMLDNAPTIEAEPVRHGRFVDGECENCGWFGDCVDVPFYNYCPKCGAKMDGAEPDDR